MGMKLAAARAPATRITPHAQPGRFANEGTICPDIRMTRLSQNLAQDRAPHPSKPINAM